MEFIAENIQKIQKNIPSDVTLIAVSKTHSVEMIKKAYDFGHLVFGESRVQEMVAKYEQLPKDIQWHMIGHLQRNKIKYIAPFVHLIHGVDDLKKLLEINKQAKRYERTVHCLLQIKIAEEDSKFGLSIKEAEQILMSDELKNLKHTFIDGFMGMASFTDNQQQIETEFATLQQFFNKSQEFKKPNFNPTILSMGMSGDYKTAITFGSTMIRVGGAIFGNRNYN